LIYGVLCIHAAGPAVPAVPSARRKSPPTSEVLQVLSSGCRAVAGQPKRNSAIRNHLTFKTSIARGRSFSYATFCHYG
jgi:hypothetical protein